nr:envelope [Xenopus tropicalis]|eukprot:XP_017946011.1 PREDICTED: syncytin-2-like [Xenopus tropicalis]
MRSLPCLLMLAICLMKVTAERNFYHETLKATAAVFNVTNCWICGKIPHATEEGIPLYGLPFNMSWINRTDPEWNFVFNMTTKQCAIARYAGTEKEQQLKLTRKSTGILCVQKNQTTETVWLGKSQCDYVVNTVNNTHVMVTGKGEMFYMFYVKQCSFDFRVTTNDTHICERSSTSSLVCCKILPSNSTRVGIYWQYQLYLATCSPLPNQLYFICGNNVYKWLPYNWAGNCYIGNIAPKFRVLFENPKGHVRNWKRHFASSHVNELPEEWDTSEENRFVMILIPHYGVAKAVQMMRRMSRIIEHALNNTLDGLTSLTEEVRQMRLVVLQNRASLDYILASKGGVCALIGDECCTYISDKSLEVEDDISEARKSVAKLHAQNTGSWLFSWLGQWGQQLFMYITSFIIFILGIFLVIKIISVCISKYTTSTIESLPIRKTGIIY